MRIERRRLTPLRVDDAVRGLGQGGGKLGRGKNLELEFAGVDLHRQSISESTRRRICD
jgi:hypothetical protein